MIDNKKTIVDNSLNHATDEINFSLIFSCFLRNKFIIGQFALAFFFLSTFYSLVKKKVWVGEFEIVISNKSEENASMFQALSANFDIPISPLRRSNLKTQVAILESPSVLMPVFDFVKNNSKDKNSNNITFEEWKSNKLNIKLKNKTSILKIFYKDKNKENIIPVLNKISNEYQKYSGESRKRGILLAKNYLSSQINLYKQKSSKSINKAQEYAIDQDLSIVNIDINKDNKIFSSIENFNDIYNNRSSVSLNTGSLASNVSIENKRISALNEIKNINLQIKKIKDFQTDYKEVQYIALSLPDLSIKKLNQELFDLDSQIVEFKSKYKKEDIFIKRLESQRNFLVELLRERTIGLLKGKKLAAEARMESATRPKEVLLKYKELIREASRDENTLISLENQFRILKLDEAKESDPWKLITVPRLQRFPLPPSRSKIALFGFLIGITIGCIVSLLKERFSGFIYDESVLKRITETEIIDSISLEKNRLEKYNKDILASEILGYKDGNNIKLIKAGLNDSILDKVIEITFLDKKKVKFESDFSSFIDNDKIILITDLNSLSYKEINTINNRLRKLNKFLFGIFLIKDF